MFTGIIQEIGKIAKVEAHQQGKSLLIKCSSILADLKKGDSIAVDGVCLTVTQISSEGFKADLSEQTMKLTTLGGCKPGRVVNLEPALRLSDRLGGHLLTGHVDGLARVLWYRVQGENALLSFQFPKELSPYIALRGSIALDGVSLTVATLGADYASVFLVPYTLANSTLSKRRENDKMNLEVDLIARYLEKLTLTQSQEQNFNSALKNLGFSSFTEET